MPEMLDLCTRDLMDTAPQIFQFIRAEMRRGRGSELSVPQFRTLRFIQVKADSTLSSIAEHLGLTLPSVSKLVDGLAKKELVIRQESASDRRCLSLALTSEGESIVNSARAGAQARLVEKLSCLSPDELETIHKGMELLRPLFVSQGKRSISK
jgi:MarR family transcriptional regulator for hemolysin